MTSNIRNYHAFISHSSKDRAYAELVCQALESHSLSCWMAPRDIQPGVEWGAAIINGIEQSSVMLVIFSSHANESAQVRREVERAIGKSMPILPFRIEEIQPEGALEFALSNTHWLDGFKPPIEPSLSQLVQSVKALHAVATNAERPASSKPEAADQPAAHKATQPAAQKANGAVPLEQTTINKPEDNSSRRIAWVTVSILVLLLLTIPAVYMTAQKMNWLGEPDETGESPAQPKEPSGLSKADFQKREMRKFLGRWIAVEESTADGGKLAPRVVNQRAFLFILKPQFASHRRNPTQTQTVTIRGKIEFYEGAFFDSFVFRGLDQDGVKQSFVGIYDFDGQTWRWCFRRSMDTNDKPPQTPLKMNTSGERNTYYVAMKAVLDKDD